MDVRTILPRATDDEAMIVERLASTGALQRGQICGCELVEPVVDMGHQRLGRALHCESQTR